MGWNVTIASISFVLSFSLLWIALKASRPTIQWRLFTGWLSGSAMMGTILQVTAMNIPSVLKSPLTCLLIVVEMTLVSRWTFGPNSIFKALGKVKK